MRLGPEDRVHIPVLNFLRAALHDAVIFHIPNGGSRHKLEAVKLKALGVLPGAPDIEIIPAANNRGMHSVYFMEIKPAKGGVVSPEQRKFGEDVYMRGCGWAVIRSVEDAANALKAWGLKTGEQIPRPVIAARVPL